MLEKRFKRNHRTASVASNTLLLLGTLVLVSAIIYLLVNLEKADSLVYVLSPFFVGGLGFILFSQLINRPNQKRRR